jgi:uncharacterized protein YjbI with pentapeptide repeats
MPISTLAGQDITMANFTNRDLSGADFRGAHQWSAHQYGLGSYTEGHPEIRLTNALFTSAALDGSKLCEVIGDYVCFCGASMKKADLSWGILSAVCFDDANLCEADFRGVRLQYSSFSNADLSDARFDHASLIGSCLSGVKTSPATTFTDANLTNVCFRNTNLRHLLGSSEVLFPGSVVRGADFRVYQTIAGARLPQLVRVDLLSRGAIVDLPSEEDWDDAAFYGGYLEQD